MNERARLTRSLRLACTRRSQAKLNERATLSCCCRSAGGVNQQRRRRRRRQRCRRCRRRRQRERVVDVVVESLRRCRCRTPSPNRNETKRNEKKVGFWNFFALALLWFSVQFDFNAQSQRTWCVTCVCLVFVFCSSSSSFVASSSTSSPCVLLRVVLLRETSARKYAKQQQQQKVQAKAKYETSATITTGEIRSNNNNKYENKNNNNNNKVRSLKKVKESKLRSLRRRWIGFDCQFSHSFSPSFPSLSVLCSAILCKLHCMLLPPSPFPCATGTTEKKRE